MTSLHEAGTYGHEKDAVFLVLGAKFRHRKVQGGLADRVRPTNIDLILPNQLDVCHAGADGDDLLHAAFLNKRQEEIEQMHVSNDVHIERGHQILLETDRVFATGRQMSE